MEKEVRLKAWAMEMEKEVDLKRRRRVWRRYLKVRPYVAAHSAGKNNKAEGGGEAFDLKNVRLK